MTRRLTHDGVPRSRFLWKNGAVETPSGQRFRVTGRPARCGIMTCATSAKYPMISDFVVPVAGYSTLRRWVRFSRCPSSSTVALSPPATGARPAPDLGDR